MGRDGETAESQVEIIPKNGEAVEIFGVFRPFTYPGEPDRLMSNAGHLESIILENIDFHDEPAKLRITVERI